MPRTSSSAAPLVVVWDNLNTHTSAAMTELITARDWLTVFQLPPYAHELNPVELVWSHLKRSLANLAKRNISQLTALVKTRLKRMQYRPGLLDGFLASTRLDLTPFCNPPPLRIVRHLGSRRAGHRAGLLLACSDGYTGAQSRADFHSIQSSS
jgi:DDE superfamily endonuclease